MEFDILYRPLHLTTATLVTVAPSSTSSTSVGAWEFPLLLKYRFPVPIPFLKPLVEAGPSFRAGSGAGASPSKHGITIGVGVEAKILKLKLAPQLRFTRWGSDNPSLLLASPVTNVNQAEFLVGLSF